MWQLLVLISVVMGPRAMASDLAKEQLEARIGALRGIKKVLVKTAVQVPINTDVPLTQKRAQEIVLKKLKEVDLDVFTVDEKERYAKEVKKVNESGRAFPILEITAIYGHSFGDQTAVSFDIALQEVVRADDDQKKFLLAWTYRAPATPLIIERKQLTQIEGMLDFQLNTFLNDYRNANGILPPQVSSDGADDPGFLEVLKQMAEKGNPESQFLLAHAYIDGKGVEKNKKLGLEWLSKAAFSGEALAQCELGMVSSKMKSEKALVVAYMLLDLCIQRNPDAEWTDPARTELKKVAKALPADKQKEAQQLSASWLKHRVAE